MADIRYAVIRSTCYRHEVVRGEAIGEAVIVVKYDAESNGENVSKNPEICHDGPHLMGKIIKVFPGDHPAQATEGEKYFAPRMCVMSYPKPTSGFAFRATDSQKPFHFQTRSKAAAIRFACSLAEELAPR